MTKKLLKLLSLVAVLALTVLTAVSCGETNPPPQPPDDPLTGSVGENVTYTLTTDGVLTLSGSGAMTDYASKDDVPYAEYAKHVSLVVIGKDITSVDPEAFLGCTSLYNFRVEAGNAVFTTDSGVLFAKDMTTLLLYPIGSPRPFYEIPAGVTAVGENAMTTNNMTLLTIPASLTTLPASAVSGLTALAEVDFYGTEEAFAALNANGAISKKVLVSCRGESASGENAYLEADPSYEFFGASESLTLSGTAKILKDGMTLYIPASAKGYVEFTVPCEQAGVYGLTIKANDLGGRVDYITLKNFSVSNLNGYITSMRHLGETNGAANHSENEYCITADAFRGGYSEYVAYTYLKTGENRIRLSITGGAYFALGIYSFRMDMVAADTENTLTVFSNENGVVPTYPNSTASQGNVSTGLFVRDGGKISYTVDVPKTGDYEVQMLAATVSNNKLTIKIDKTTLLSKSVTPAPAEGSTSVGFVSLGALSLKAGKQTLVMDTAKWINIIAFRLVPVDEAPVAKKPVVSGSTTLVLNQGETDLFKEDTLFPTGASAFENGILTLNAGTGNFVYLLANVEKAGVYCIRYAGKSGEQDFTVMNASLVQGGIDGTGIVNANADFSYGWERADDGYSNYGVYVYLKKGENFIQFTAGSNATLTGIKMAPVYLAPDYFMLSTKTAQGSDLGPQIDDTTFAATLYGKDKLNYTVSVAGAGSYELGGMFAGAAVEIAVYDKNGNSVYNATLDPSSEEYATVGASANFLGFATVGSVNLAVGEYTVSVSGTDAANASKVSFMTLRSANGASGDAVMSVARGTDSGAAVTVAVNKTLDAKSPITISVNVPDGGVYMMELAGNFSGSKNTVYVSSSAFPGIYSANRDKDIGATKNGVFSKYAYCVLLNSGMNEIYCCINYGNLTIDIKNIRLTRVAEKPSATTRGYINGVNGYDIDAIYAQYGSKAEYQAQRTGSTSENSTYGIKLLRGQAGTKTELVYRNITVEKDGPYVLSGLLMGTYVNVNIIDSVGRSVASVDGFKISYGGVLTDGSETAHFVNNIMTVNLKAGENYTLIATAGNNLYTTVSAFMLTMGEHEHEYTKNESVAATCTTDGYNAMVCAMCGARDPQNTEVIPAIGHVANDVYTVEREPGCTSVGWEQLHCKHCDDIIAGSIRFLDKLGHSYATEYTMDRNNTCNVDGQKSYHCTVCDAIDPASIVVIPADASLHVYTNCIIISQPTAEATGRAELRCIHCDGKGETFILAKIETPTVEDIVVGADAITASGKTATVKVNVATAGMYYFEAKYVLSAKSYITATVNGVSSKNRWVADTPNADGYQKYGFMLYLVAGENTISLKAEAANIDVMTGGRFIFEAKAPDVIYAKNLQQIVGGSSGKSSHTMTLTVEKSGLYTMSALMVAEVSLKVTYTFTDAEGNETIIDLDTLPDMVKQLNAKYPDRLLDGSSATANTYMDLFMIYLAAGEYTVTVNRTAGNYFNHAAGMLTEIPLVQN